MTASPIRIAIADDHSIVRDGLRRLLDSEPGFQVVAEAADGVEAVRVTQDLQPDVLLLDVAMPRLGGVEALVSLQHLKTRVLLLTAAIEPPDLLRAIQLGAYGVVLKESATAMLIDGIRRVMEGKYLLAGGTADDLAHAIREVRAPAATRFGLTPRELEIVAAIVAGETNKTMSDRLRISPQTVKHHLTSIFDKTGVSNRLELALFALRHELVDRS
jgi:two-component system nitrate/nitrite response regulator NarL